MEFPEEFKQFCAGLHQDYDLYGAEPVDWIQGALDRVAPQDRLLLAAFVRRILMSGHSDAEIDEMFHNCGSELRIFTGARVFLKLMVDVIEDGASR